MSDHPFADVIKIPVKQSGARRRPGQKLPQVLAEGEKPTVSSVADAPSSMPVPAAPSRWRGGAPPYVQLRVMRRIGRGRLVESLRHSEDERLLKFLALLEDPRNANLELRDLYQRCKLSVLDILGAFRRYQLDLAMVELFEQLPELTRDSVKVALSRMGNCKRCDGEGVVDKAKDGTGGRKCPECKGKKSVRVAGDSAARNLVMEAAGVVGRRSVTIQAGKGHGAGDFESDISNVVVVPAREVKE
jgi:hypothetical protein